ncbi:Abortive infection bacteriophage resistance protein [Nitrosococcus oceani ATCC 19707]|uniref:Abortive infection bacteriophage resistance protein n=2 Tax=Nitrosococcus oceani TaxID=1229 RepID=Q3JA70_NITOC|nr:Abi family protein [Nitrosococcus oceani]ABA58276.1 Abortive infection bacteriophage resistance protein [Nitrosococcus oceani ATCC 19707]KFI19282.1 abortive phage resistance protein [Nitrosococcus oceani C-27]GEM18657.1 abortive phage resistance protein [Nitrosococcus oceani]
MTPTPKSWKPFGEQLEILMERGLQVDDCEAAKSYLQRIGYYRLSGYWYPFRQLERQQGDGGKISDRRSNVFVAGSHFREVVQLYVFDKKLRLLALDALERIEMALRVDIAHLLGKQDIHAHENPNCFHGHFSKQIQRKGYAKGKTWHQVWLERYQQNLHRARREPFVEHYLKKYGQLPIWVAVEVWDFGMMSKLYAGMKPADKGRIAAKYGATDGGTLAEWVRSLNFIRNVSAHHSRLWNINVLERSAPLVDDSYWQTLSNARPFFYFCLIQKLLRNICPNSTWAQRFQALVQEFPATVSGTVSLQDMGMPESWETWELWR